MKWIAGFLVAFIVGFGSRLLDIPAPAPPQFAGLLMILAITTGYSAADHFLSEQPAEAAEAAETSRPAATDPRDPRRTRRSGEQPRLAKRPTADSERRPTARR